MKAFTEDDGYWGNKVNFVDDNNVLVGYDLSQCCCEHADWFIDDKVAKNFPEDLNQPSKIEGYNFDIDFFEEIHHLSRDGSDWNALDMGGMAVFRLINGDKEMYLHLFNCHNGYYAHGFSVEHNGEKISSGSL